MRVVGGTLRGRPLEAPPDSAIRPTSDKVRQAVFNILASMGLPDGAVALDGFCGTGALGIEALSRGASHCHFLDRAAASLKLCARNLDRLGVRAAASLYQRDALQPGMAPGQGAAAGLFFLDPPYAKDLAMPAMTALLEGGWLASGAVGVIETEIGGAGAPGPDFDLLDRRLYGDTSVLIVRRRPS